ncbi:MAG: AAA family ATPase [Mogibacterium sp.]|nr:AAA family ATPase [Mogibacterium sp.]
MTETKNKSTNFKSAEELFFNPVRCSNAEMIVDGLIPTGLTIVAGAPKSCKSWLMLDLALSVSLGKPFLGHEVKQCGVAYYALEDTDARIKSRLLDIGIVPASGMIYATSVKDPGSDFVSDLKSCLDEHPDVRLVIVDTLQKIRNNSEFPSNAGQYGCEYEELTKLKDIADQRNIAIVLVHHTRKKHDTIDGNNDVLGSSAVTGTADMILILRKNRGGTAGTLSVCGRDAPDIELMMQWQHPEWQVIEEKSEEDIAKEKVPEVVYRVIDYLMAEGGFTGTMSALLSELGLSHIKPHVLSRALSKFHDEILLPLGITYDSRRTSGERSYVFTVADESACASVDLPNMSGESDQ